MRVLRVLFVLAVVAALSACGSARDTTATTPSSCTALPTGTACPQSSTLTYANFGQGFFSTFCLRCHSVNVTGDARNGATIGVNFDTIDGIRTNRCRIDDFAGNGPSQNRRIMPFDIPLTPPLVFPTDDQRSQLSQWLACGAP
jgi:uncharacterized membrane protein